MSSLTVLIAILAALLCLGYLETLAHRRQLARIPIRIHVNGTRGKSSVTRLIAASLRAGGIATCAKTTGTLPRMILPSGQEYPVFRPAEPNIIEQIRIVRTAAQWKAQALVVECMALQPHYQWLCEAKLVRATIGVITNAREDHLDVMGPTESDVAAALAGMIPPGKVLFTAEQKQWGVLANAAADRQCQLIGLTAAEIADVTPAELARFAYVEHAENVALALKVCASLGVDRAVALEGMAAAQPDPGAMTDHTINFFGRELFFVNGFAANDPQSTERIWRMAIARFPQATRRIAIFNCRADRADRSQQLGRACAAWPMADFYLLIGSGTYFFARAANRAGIDMQRVILAEGQRVDEIFETVLERVQGPTLLMGMGNIGGMGLEVVRYFKNRSQLSEIR